MDWKIPEEAGLPMVFYKPRLTQNKTLRVLLDRIILEVNVWALIITIILTLVFERYLFPKGTLGWTLNSKTPTEWPGLSRIIVFHGIYLSCRLISQLFYVDGGVRCEKVSQRTGFHLVVCPPHSCSPAISSRPSSLSYHLRPSFTPFSLTPGTTSYKVSSEVFKLTK